MICVKALINYLLAHSFLLTFPASTDIGLKLRTWTLTTCDLQSMFHVPLAGFIPLGTALVLNHASRVVDLMPFVLVTEVEMTVLSYNKSVLLTQSEWACSI